MNEFLLCLETAVNILFFEVQLKGLFRLFIGICRYLVSVSNLTGRLTLTVCPSLLTSFLLPLEYQTSLLPSRNLFSRVPLSGSTLTSVTSLESWLTLEDYLLKLSHYTYQRAGILSLYLNSNLRNI